MRRGTTGTAGEETGSHESWLKSVNMEAPTTPKAGADTQDRDQGQRQNSLSGHLSNRLNTAPPVLEGQGLSLLCQGLHKPIHNPESQGILTVGVLLEAPG